MPPGASLPFASCPVWPARNTMRCGPLTSTTCEYVGGDAIPCGLLWRTEAVWAAAGVDVTAPAAAASVTAAATTSRRDLPGSLTDEEDVHSVVMIGSC